MTFKHYSPKNNTHCKFARGVGFSLFEFAIVIALMGLLGGTLVNRVINYQYEAEIAAMETTVGALRSALHLKAAQLYVKGKSSAINELVDENPMDWLLERPKNYAGEFFSPALSQVGQGNWYFDRTDKKLVYLLNNVKEIKGVPSRVVKYKVKLISNSANLSNVHSSPDIMDGIVLEQTDG